MSHVGELDASVVRLVEDGGVDEADVVVVAEETVFLAWVGGVGADELSDVVEQGGGMLVLLSTS